MKKYKLITNIEGKEKTIYFDRLTKNKIIEISNCNNYILSYYHNFLKDYMLLIEKK